MAMSEKQKMLAGELYHPGDPEILADQAAAKAWMVRYNAALAASPDERRALLAERLASVGAGAVIRPPFHCDYGYNIHLGEGAFLNFNCVILDVVEVHIGAGAQIGPAVQLYTADHPRDPEARRSGVEFGRPTREDDRPATDPYRSQRLGRWRGDHPPGCDGGRRCGDRCRQRGHPRRAGRRHRGRQPGAGALTGSLGRSTPSLGRPATPACYACARPPPEDVATTCRT